MDNIKQLTIEVAYATVETQKIISLQVIRGSTIETVIDKSGILEFFPEIDLSHQKIGIFSKSKKLTDIVSDGDRIEIYRPLSIDPKEARRKRVIRPSRRSGIVK
jgi:putative ubiquitin-RnfH superfamily antitoxin RatB of RatAB toxin-antitoxin module